MSRSIFLRTSFLGRHAGRSEYMYGFMYAEHLIRCSAYMNPYIYSDLPACRPKNETRKKMLRDMYDM